MSDATAENQEASESEEVKRLEPTKDTIRELFVKSGNECAFPECGHRIIDENGVFIAQICHIEAAEKRGQRFNENMTNESRRHVSNLMLMCHKHHKITDNVDLYPVDRLQEMKRRHEARFTNAVETIYKSIVDEMTTLVPAVPQTLARYIAVLETPSHEQVDKSLCNSISELVSNLQKLPRRTREILVSIVRRCEDASFGNGYGSLPLIEIVNACNLSRREANQQLQVMEKYGIAKLDDDTGRIMLWCIGEDGTWDFWSDLRAFCGKTGTALSEFVVDLKFDLLD